MSEDAKISELNETFSLDSLDWFTILDQSALPPDGDNAKISAPNVRNYMSYISQAQATDLTDAGESNLHYHQSDRANAAETLTFAGSNPTIDTDTATKLFLSLAGTYSFGFHETIGGSSFLNFQFGDIEPKANSSLTCTGTTATATTAVAHGLVTGLLVNISGATPAGYNGNFAVTVTGANTFTYTVATPDLADADPDGTWNILPTCIIMGATDPTTGPVTSLLPYISYGSIYIWTNPPNVTSALYSKQKDGGGNAIWDSKA